MPFDEDYWREFEIGGVRYAVVKPCARCSMPTVVQAEGRRDPKLQPVKTMRTFRTRQDQTGLQPGEDGDIYFGQNVIQLRRRQTTTTTTATAAAAAGGAGAVAGGGGRVRASGGRDKIYGVIRADMPVAITSYAPAPNVKVGPSIKRR